MPPLQQTLAMSLPFIIYIMIKVYLDTGKIEWSGFVFIIMGVISIFQWISTYRKGKYLKQEIDWVG